MSDHCPRDGSELVEVERSGVKIDACPTCRGVWFDRGELEKVIERESKQRDAADEDFLREVTGGRDRSDRRHHEYDDRYQHYKKRRKKSLLEELFD